MVGGAALGPIDVGVDGFAIPGEGDPRLVHRVRQVFRRLRPHQHMEPVVADQVEHEGDLERVRGTQHPVEGGALPVEAVLPHRRVVHLRRDHRLGGHPEHEVGHERDLHLGRGGLGVIRLIRGQRSARVLGQQAQSVEQLLPSVRWCGHHGEQLPLLEVGADQQ